MHTRATHLLFIVTRVLGVGHRDDGRVIKVVDLLIRFGLHKPVERQESGHGRIGHHEHV